MNTKISFDLLLSDGRSTESKTKKDSLKLIIMSDLYRSGDKSIPEMSGVIHMSTPTITRAVDELIASGFLIEKGIGNSNGGRRPSLYGLNPEAKYSYSESTSAGILSGSGC